MPARILIVEDNPANLEVMRYLLHAHGHTVLSAADGESGVEIVRKDRPDLVLCDVQLPKLDGYGVIRQLKSDPAYCNIPLIAITAFAHGGRSREDALGRI